MNSLIKIYPLLYLINKKNFCLAYVKQRRYKNDSLSNCFNIGPDVASSSSSSSDLSDVEAGKRVKLKHDYKSNNENWKEAKVKHYFISLLFLFINFFILFKLFISGRSPNFLKIALSWLRGLALFCLHRVVQPVCRGILNQMLN